MLEGSILDPDYCIVDRNGNCGRHNPPVEKRAVIQQIIGDSPSRGERWYVFCDGKLLADFANERKEAAYGFLDGVRTMLYIEETK
jgi:hypothetical protein